MISYQLYSSRNFPPTGDTLRMLKSAGYDAVEGFGGVYPDEAAATPLAADLKSVGLTMPTGHFAVDHVEKDPDQVIRMARTLGMDTIICPYLLPDQRPTDAAGWTAFGKRLEAAGAPIRAAGLKFGWHNHDFEFVSLPGGEVPHDLMFDAAPSLGWEIDVAWVVKGGKDPVRYIMRYGPRILTAHVKDIAPPGEKANEDGWADVGTGVVQWKAAYAALKAAGCTRFIMEHDNPSDHARFAKNSISALKGMMA
ncbi:MAG: sugar phosphate isomerase/epimerase [Rhodobacteraceae bacterium]|jgi:sugar phosphate isomerase/epimerase|nr:sugar phosphate isomerase/epimerase [Paracoccaceae bacterium]